LLDFPLDLAELFIGIRLLDPRISLDGEGDESFRIKVSRHVVDKIPPPQEELTSLHSTLLKPEAHPIVVAPI
jgi:hypothetical protein